MKSFDIIANRKKFYTATGVFILAGLIVIAVFGFNLDVDFTGGTTFTIDTGVYLDRAAQDDITALVEGVTGEKPSSVQRSGAEGTVVVIKTKDLPSQTREAVFEAIQQEYGLEDNARLSVENVSATVGDDMKKGALYSTLLAALLMLVYIAFRFEPITGIATVLALVHDVIIILIFYSVSRIPMNLTFIAAVLTIVGYSINSTIVIFDRVRENKKLSSKTGLDEIMNKSIWETFTRSAYTSLTTLFTVVALCVFGVTSIRQFALPLAAGIIAGFYSSVFLACALWHDVARLFTKRKKA